MFNIIPSIRFYRSGQFFKAPPELIHDNSTANDSASPGQSHQDEDKASIEDALCKWITLYTHIVPKKSPHQLLGENTNHCSLHKTSELAKIDELTQLVYQDSVSSALLLMGCKAEVKDQIVASQYSIIKLALQNKITAPQCTCILDLLQKEFRLENDALTLRMNCLIQFEPFVCVLNTLLRFYGYRHVSSLEDISIALYIQLNFFSIVKADQDDSQCHEVKNTSNGGNGVCEDDDPTFITCLPRPRESCPLVILIGGASGTGKSTISSILASRIGIYSVVSTDTIRHTLRATCTLGNSAPMLEEKFSKIAKPSYLKTLGILDPAPSLRELLVTTMNASTYNVAQEISKDLKLVGATRYNNRQRLSQTKNRGRPSSDRQKRVVTGYKLQSKTVMEFVEKIIMDSVRKGKSIAVEGVHLTCKIMLHIMSVVPNCVPFVITTNNELKHINKFSVRGENMSLERNENKYVEHFGNIRIIQDYFLMKAEKHNVPIINNNNVDKSLSIIHATIFSSISSMHKVEIIRQGDLMSLGISRTGQLLERDEVRCNVQKKTTLTKEEALRQIKSRRLKRIEQYWRLGMDMRNNLANRSTSEPENDAMTRIFDESSFKADVKNVQSCQEDISQRKKGTYWEEVDPSCESLASDDPETQNQHHWWNPA